MKIPSFHRKQIREISNTGYKNKIDQACIDLIQRAEQFLVEFEDYKRPKENLGSLLYRINNILKVYNPEHELEVHLLTSLKDVLEDIRKIQNEIEEKESKRKMQLP